MRLVTYERGGTESIGALLDGDSVVDLAAATDEAPAYFGSMQALIEAGEPALRHARAIVEAAPETAVLGLCDVALLAPLPRPVKMRDCQLFLEHLQAVGEMMLRQKAGADGPGVEGSYHLAPIVSERIIYYNCDTTAVCGTGQEAIWPGETDWMDFELEWACVVGKDGRNISPAQAREHIFGYTIFNDLSARDVQLAVMAGQIGPGAGKDFDNSNPIGPCIVTADAVPDPYALTMTASVNGERWSQGSTGSMHHRFEDAIVMLSRDRQLHAGEIIASGTVLSGCGFELQRRLSPGDVVELHVEAIGSLVTTVRQAERRS
ncbi:MULTISPECIES: fumarylacetoacetate hydrolase family protein [unclassified Sphingomonas]|uniref:fumarylacetoacetate hydrolase family protein n=1 Tax=unclassified Sphingomonas TaxID=196159 RepID=UPI0006F32D5C|nr:MULTISPECIES: fumarylacetoacetate hydrolase family protein [unclassified Sphingomonas]KQX19241.1 fumarylacetoacetate hydrolase [Sphingomonas sp. Root1294]KQY65443.1 fumarylacetoacetate hydrolase [Sphingomonas sp. Root50]KRB95259.1 fumarylacetoacetate hydrolase [Sphingomonas sp. Root720]